MTGSGDSTPQTFRMYVGGAWTDATGGKTYDIVNPATEEVIARAPDATRESDRRGAPCLR